MNFRDITRNEWLLLALLVTAGVASRFFIETPNFKPIAAFALMGGFLFRKPILVGGAVIGMMWLSDLQLGFYQLPLMVSVYASLAVAVMLGVAIGSRSNRGEQSGRSSQSGWSLMGRFVGASLLMSTVFYLLTNGAVWWMGSGYPPTMAGLFECYVAGLPFYRWTAMGDLFFTTVIAGGYLLASVKVESPAPALD
jgi:hypothetical protein